MRDHLNNNDVEIIDISPMGCRTGFYMSLIGTPSWEMVAKAWEESMKDILNVKSQDDIPELNKYQCGTCTLHSLDEAQDIARNILAKGVGYIDNEAIKLDMSKI